MENTEKKSLVPLYLTVFLVVMIVERLGKFTFHIGPAAITIFPFLIGMLVMCVLTLSKKISFITTEFCPLAEKWIIYGTSLYLARVGINAGAEIMELIKAGPALLLQEFGNIGTMVFAFPLALFWGLRRESIGMTFSIAREQGVAIISSRYDGLGGPEGRGVMVTYVVGYLVGTLTMSVLPSLLAALTPLHPYSLAMACGVGSASMMAAGVATLTDLFPTMADSITSYAATSQTLSACDGTLMAVIIVLPLMEFLYKKMQPVLERKR